MKVISKSILLIIVMMCAPAVNGALAQSIFGLPFIGEHRFRGDARNRALGISAFAVPDSSSALIGNPASLAGLERVTLSFVEVLALSRINAGGEVSDQSRFQLPGLMLAFPIREGLVFRVGYHTRFEGKGDFSIADSMVGAPTPFEMHRHRSSLFTAPLALAWKADDWISLAGELQVEGGTIKDEVAITFDNEDYVPAVSKRQRRFSAASWCVGLLLRLHERLYVGGLWDARVNYDVDEKWSHTRSEYDSTGTSEFSLPDAFGVGLAFGLSERWWLTTYFWARKAPEPEGFTQLEKSLRGERLVSIGLERRRNSADGFFERLPVRLGFYENRWHLEFPAGEGITGRFLTLGTGFRMPGGPGVLDLSVEIGQIGSESRNGLTERVMRIGVGMNVSEAWSRRREEM